jgi:N-ethylmaleimide reductase
MTTELKLLQPLTVGAIELRNRVVMAPMTRSRADDNGLPTDMVTEYYSQRASAGLIVSEGTFPSAMGKGYVRTPGIHTDAQVAAWRKVTDSVHAANGRIFCQIMHAGRISHPSLLPGGTTPIAPSEVKPKGEVYTDEGMRAYETPRAIETGEIAGVVAEYAHATRCALDAGFDGVELHAASGYLPEQFLSSSTNLRTDGYGGSIENRARFALEVLDAMIGVAGAGRVGIKIAPEMGFNDISDATPQQTFTYLVDQLNRRGLAYLHVARYGDAVDYFDLLRPRFSGPFFAGNGLTRASGEALIRDGKADAAVFGKLFIANPDLPERFRRDAALNEPDPDTFYSPGPEGYTDYPAL